MKYMVTVSQKRAVEMGLAGRLDISDFAILDLFVSMLASPGIQKQHIDGETFLMFSHTLIIQQMPLLGISGRAAIKQRIKKLCDAGLLKAHPDNVKTRRPMYAGGELLAEYLLPGEPSAKPDGTVHETGRYRPRNRTVTVRETGRYKEIKDKEIKDKEIKNKAVAYLTEESLLNSRASFDKSGGGGENENFDNSKQPKRTQNGTKTKPEPLNSKKKEKEKSSAKKERERKKPNKRAVSDFFDEAAQTPIKRKKCQHEAKEAANLENSDCATTPQPEERPYTPNDSLPVGAKILQEWEELQPKVQAYAEKHGIPESEAWLIGAMKRWRAFFVERYPNLKRVWCDQLRLKITGDDFWAELSKFLRYYQQNKRVMLAPEESQRMFFSWLKKYKNIQVAEQARRADAMLKRKEAGASRNTSGLFSGIAERKAL